MNIKWESEKYTDNFDFVYKYGEGVLELIDTPKGSFAVDLGCGNGALSERLIEKGYEVLGIDASADMIEAARRLHPDISFECADILEFNLSQKADVIFSNAVLHWIDADKQEAAIRNISSQLKPNGQFVCEFGGKGCAEAVHSALERNFKKHGFVYPRVFYFPTIGEYAPILEKYGLKVEYAVLFDRPTEQKTENGLENWIRMFVKKPFENMDKVMQDDIINETVNELRGTLCKDNKWIVDYVRIRIKARKEF